MTPIFNIYIQYGYISVTRKDKKKRKVQINPKAAYFSVPRLCLPFFKGFQYGSLISFFIFSNSSYSTRKKKCLVLESRHWFLNTLGFSFLLICNLKVKFYSLFFLFIFKFLLVSYEVVVPQSRHVSFFFFWSCLVAFPLGSGVLVCVWLSSHTGMILQGCWESLILITAAVSAFSSLHV